MHCSLRSVLALVCTMLTLCLTTPADAIQTFPGGLVQGERTLSDPNLAQSGTIRLSGNATFGDPLTVTVPFVNTGTVNPSLWATAPEILVSLTQAEGRISDGYSLTVFNVNHNTFSLTIRPNTPGVVLRKIIVSYIAVGRRS